MIHLGNGSANVPAVVLGSQDTVRCLGPFGINVIVVASNPEHLGFRSRYCTKAVRVSDFVRHPDAAISELIALGRTIDTKPVLLNCGDNDLLLISRHRHELARYFHLILPDEELVERVVDKIRFNELAASHQIPTPKTFVVASLSELREKIEEIPFPCVVKPSNPTKWWSDEFISLFEDQIVEAVVVESMQGLIKLYREIAVLDRSILIQEYIPGGDENLFSFNAYFDQHGKPVAYFTGRKIMNYPIRLGSGCMDQICHDTDVEALGLEILQKLHFKGVAKVDFKRDIRDGSLKVFEINPRFSFWCYLGAAAGINLPLIAYYNVQGRKVNPGLNTRAIAEGVKWVNFKDSLKAFLVYRCLKEWTLRHWLKSFRGRKVYHVFAWHDPGPFFYSCRIFIRKHTSGGLRSLVRKIRAIPRTLRRERRTEHWLGTYSN